MNVVLPMNDSNDVDDHDLKHSQDVVHYYYDVQTNVLMIDVDSKNDEHLNLKNLKHSLLYDVDVNASDVSMDDDLKKNLHSYLYSDNYVALLNDENDDLYDQNDYYDDEYDFDLNDADADN